jgi:DNA polymerase II small subunit
MELKEKEIIQYATEKELVVNKKAMELLKQRDDFKKIIDSLVEENKFVLNEKLVEEKILALKSKFKAIEPEVVIEKSGFKPKAKEIEPKIRELNELNVTNQSFSEGTVKNFLQMFQDKFLSLEAILKQRHHLNPKPINRLRAIPNNNSVELIAMVRDRFKSKQGNLVFYLEDLEDECIGVVSKENTQLTELSERILPDSVIGVKGNKASEKMVIIKEIFLPEIPQRPIKKTKEDLSILAISDLHVGSQLFLENAFRKMLSWLKGEIGSKKEKEKVGKIKYLMILGDNCDGIGVYPEQLNELSIRSVFEQYEFLTELLKEIPEYIEVCIIPGQHDAVRWSDPQPAIGKEFVKELYELKNFHFLSSPGWVEIEGLKALLYHGPSLHDLFASVSQLSYSEPQKAMIELLKRRDLMPSYGMKRPYVPEKKDYMVIREVPDLFFGGELHHNGYATYRGTVVMSCGTWQSKTNYQIQQGHIPTPGIAAIY